MSPLADTVYDILRQRTRLAEGRITYAQLAEQLRDACDDFFHIHHRSRQLYAALGEVGRECRRLKLPPLPALVVRADTHRPGEAYYAGRCLGTRYQGEKVKSWQRDLESVMQARYPPLERGSRNKTRSTSKKPARRKASPIYQASVSRKIVPILNLTANGF
jgi:hypothetical protein